VWRSTRSLRPVRRGILKEVDIPYKRLDVLFVPTLVLETPAV